MKTIFYSVLFLLFSGSCGSPAEKENASGERVQEVQSTVKEPGHEAGHEELAHTRRSYFKQFFEKFRELELPLVMKLNWGEDTFNGPRADIDSNDTLFIQEDDQGWLTCYGRLKDTSGYYAFIVIYPADGPVPVLYTYSKDLKLLSRAYLVARGCGADCGVEKCTTTAVIDENYRLYFADSLDYMECDKMRTRVTDSTLHRTVEYQEGKIDRSGKIRLSEIKQVELD